MAEFKLNNLIFAGIDGGGTNCRVRLETEEGEFLGEGFGGTANPSHGLETVEASILTAVEEAIASSNLSADGISSLVVGAGLAGLHLPAYMDVMTSWKHPFRSLYLTDDLKTALYGAHGGNDGAVIIVGTGFSATSVVNNIDYPIGGYGFLMGDYCSGSWIGFQAVQKVILAKDGLAEPTILVELIQEKLGSDMIVEKLIGAKASDYGRLAPIVFQAAERGDVVANEILDGCAQFINKVSLKLFESKPPRFSILGGVAKKITNRLDDKVRKMLSGPISSPEQGAIHFAKAHYYKDISDSQSKLLGGI